MIGIDTNVLVRYLTRDDQIQTALATKLFEKRLSPTEPGLISLPVLVETCWVLRSAYSVSTAEVLETVADLLEVTVLVVANRGEVLAALVLAKKGGGDFIDCLITELGSAQGVSQTVTFDTKAAKKAGMSLLNSSPV